LFGTKEGHNSIFFFFGSPHSRTETLIREGCSHFRSLFWRFYSIIQARTTDQNSLH